MFDAVWDVEVGYVLCGIIWSLACGFAVGNYACSLVHRLPRGKLMTDKTPYCGNCGTLLQTADLFPVFSALWLRHRCRYCKQPFPVSHTWTELLVGLLFVMAYFQHGYGEYFILISAIGVFFITLAAIEVNDRIIMGKILLCLVIAGMIYRTLVDGSIYGFVQATIYGGLLGALIWKRAIQKIGHIYVFPKQALLLATCGLCVGEKQILVFALMAACLLVAFFILACLRRKPLALSVPLGLATMICVLYPHLTLSHFIAW